MAVARALIAKRIGSRPVIVNAHESPLGWLRSRGLVSARQFVSGEALRADYERAALSPSVTMRWDASGVRAPRGTPAVDASAPQLSAKGRFDAALAAAGPGLADVLWRVVCAGEGLPQAERNLGWPTRSGRLVLTLALDRVADYYCVPGANSGG